MKEENKTYFIIYRYPLGVSLNSPEYLLNNNGSLILFTDYNEACEFMRESGYWNGDKEMMNFHVEEVSATSKGDYLLFNIGFKLKKGKLQ